LATEREDKNFKELSKINYFHSTLTKQHNSAKILAAAIAVIPLRSYCGQSSTVRCPGHTIQFMRYEYGDYVRRVVELSGRGRLEVKNYASWRPY